MRVTVHYDARSLLINGERTLLLSGAMHYPRSTPAMWPDLMRRSREAGLNCVETLVFWNVHEPERGKYDFSGRYELRRYCEAAAAEGLHVILRIGPYICAEFNYGGFPFWLRDLPGMKFRTWNEPFMREMERWCRKLMEVIRPLLASNGGPIILVQFENEYNNIAAQYGEDGQRYLQWCVELGESLGIREPMIMCAGGAEGAIETINSFYLYDQLEDHWENHPDQPALSTEFYPGWYETWGYPRHTREAGNMAYALLRFVAGGGSGINYYMWHGGTNFGRESMYLQIPCYDFDCPLSEGGLLTAKGRRLARVHQLLQAQAGRLLGQERAAPVALDVVCREGTGGSRTKRLKAIGGGMPGTFEDEEAGIPPVFFSYGDAAGSLVFLCNDDSVEKVTVRYQGAEYVLPPQSATVLVDGRVVLNSAEEHPQDRVEYDLEPVSRCDAFESRSERFPEDWPADAPAPQMMTEPQEQLQFTHDRTDYCWYSADLPEGAEGRGTLVLEAAADLVYIFVDGRRMAVTPVPLPENRNLFPESGTLEDNPIWEPVRGVTFEQTFTLILPPGARRLQLLCCALGLVKGDWMLGLQNMVHERKGLWRSVTWNGTPILNWQVRPGLLGDRADADRDPGIVPGWRRPEEKGTLELPCWWRSHFARPAGSAPLFLDLDGMGKGLIYLNGRCLCRYWLIETTGVDPFNPYREPVMSCECVQPSQRYYHIPWEWLEDDNALILLEETGVRPREWTLLQQTTCREKGREQA